MRPTPSMYLVMLVIVAAQLGWFLPKLTEPMASSFGFDGVPGAWSGKSSFLVAYLVSLAVTTSIFLAMPTLMRRSDGKGINIPHSDYWLASERIEETYDIIANQLRWFGLVTVLFLIWTHHLVILANLSDPVRMASAPFWAGFVAFMLYAAWWTLRLILRFQKRPDA